MRTKRLGGLLSCMVSVVLLLGLLPLRVYGQAYTADEVNSLIGGILTAQTAGASLQDWVNGPLTAGAGATSEWYIIGLSQYSGEDLSSYRTALESYLSGANVASATSREKFALALCASGSQSPYITDTITDSVGQQGIMSLIYGLHLLNNGYTSPACTADSVADSLLALQYPDGGWALFGDYGDIDVTAMTLQSLAPLVPYRSDVAAAADRGITFLSERQQEDGGYKSFGTANAESTAQVLCALSALGIDSSYDARFIKNDHTVMDGLLQYRLDDGRFCHVIDGGLNDTATVQAFYSLIAYRRMLLGQTPLLVLDRRLPVEQPTEPVTETEAVQTQAQETTHRSETVYSVSEESAASVTTSAAAASSLTGSGTSTSTDTTVTTTSGTSSAWTSTASETDTSETEDTTFNETTAPTPPQETSTGRLKPILLVIVLAAGGAACLVLFLLKKRSPKNFIFVAVLTAAGCALVWFSDIRTPEEYYGAAVHKDNAIGTVTLEIRCDTVVGKSDAEYIPEDGVILPVTVFEIAEGDTVFDILTEAAQTCGIQMENTGSAGNAHGLVYIAGINHLYEYEFGDLSGWVYHVNGVSPSRGCGDYVLSDGDVIEWLYTCDLGRDLNEVYEE